MLLLEPKIYGFVSNVHKVHGNSDHNDQIIAA